MLAWIALNTVGIVKHWDPYPFILLNLAFSTQAAYAAPLILLAQNRQDDRDRANIDRDREVAARTQADTEYLARELAAVRLALADVVTTEDLDDSLTRMAKLVTDVRPLPGPPSSGPPSSGPPSSGPPSSGPPSSGPPSSGPPSSGPPSPEAPRPESLAAPRSLVRPDSLTSPGNQPGPNHAQPADDPELPRRYRPRVASEAMGNCPKPPIPGHPMISEEPIWLSTTSIPSSGNWCGR